MNAFQLKLIAVVSMLIDHVGLTFHSPERDLLLLRHVGRMAFPLFAFLVIESCVHTRDMKKYMGRLLVFGFLSQLPFTLLLQVPLWGIGNIFFTLFGGVLFIYLYKLAIQSGELLPLLWFMTLFAFGFVLADRLNVDYRGMGVTFVVVGYIARTYPQKHQRYGVMVAFAVMLAILYPPVTANNLRVFAWACGSLIPIGIYDGSRGYRQSWRKWLFYGFYPLHLWVLVLLRG